MYPFNKVNFVHLQSGIKHIFFPLTISSRRIPKLQTSSFVVSWPNVAYYGEIYPLQEQGNKKNCLKNLCSAYSISRLKQNNLSIIIKLLVIFNKC